MVIWITGLSGSGKTTLCRALYSRLKARLPQLAWLDGDAVRAALGHDLGYSEADRVVQVQRLQRLAKILADQDLAVLVAAVYAHPDLLAWNRANLPGYFEVLLDSPIETVRARDPKGLYRQAASGETAHVVGVGIPWHRPVHPDLILSGEGPLSADAMAERIIEAVPGLKRLAASG